MDGQKYGRTKRWTHLSSQKTRFLANLYNFRSFYIHVILHVIYVLYNTYMYTCYIYTCYIYNTCYIRVIYIYVLIACYTLSGKIWSGKIWTDKIWTDKNMDGQKYGRTKRWTHLPFLSTFCPSKFRPIRYAKVRPDI